jgi:hypothetical protein
MFKSVISEGKNCETNKINSISILFNKFLENSSNKYFSQNYTVGRDSVFFNRQLKKLPNFTDDLLKYLKKSWDILCRFFL